ncbi:MAG: EamA family transporter [Ruminococcus sp.]|uniref:EamA family transporter n=1 Tax=Ruminococcus sp. TaxID=41978 RepID=UPI002873D337|nr:EamA family transporter [Ruminococcus sp.]MBQ3284221.1 EamA family transporter [Ruminococcus sp.]
MWELTYPILIIVLSNTVYNICAKSTPAGINSFASLTITYLVAAGLSFTMFLISAKGKGIAAEFGKANWSSFVLGIVIIGLELGYILAYRNGWKMNTVSVTANIALAVILIVIAFIFYKETMTVKQVLGIILCSGGLVLINI